MPIYNMNGGGSNLTYTVKFSLLRPDQSINPKTGEEYVDVPPKVAAKPASSAFFCIASIVRMGVTIAITPYVGVC